MSDKHILVENAHQNNLKNLDLKLPHGELIVVTGVSGSGKSTLAFDTIYAEGQRRYVETFSPYARQFLDRMDKPRVDRIDGIPPAIAIDQTNPVRTSRSTVGTMTELNDHVKLLYARVAQLCCRQCGDLVQHDSAQAIAARYIDADSSGQQRIMITFTVRVPDNFDEAEIEDWLKRQGYTRIHARKRQTLEIIQDRLRLTPENIGRLTEAVEAALKYGQGELTVYPLDSDRQPGKPARYSSALRCSRCKIDYQLPTPSLFSFNSPVGACDSCRGFGRTMGIDYRLVIPDESKTLRGGAVKVWQTKTNAICQRDMVKYAKSSRIPLDKPWNSLNEKQQRWVIYGNEASGGSWYGIKGFFDWLEGRAYKMHVRVMLSKYRSYDECESCMGARLKETALLWRLGTLAEAKTVIDPAQRFVPAGSTLSRRRLNSLPGLCVHDLMRLPLSRTQQFFRDFAPAGHLDKATRLLLDEIRSRLEYLNDVGLGYLTLDRQSRTLSGGEVQRINLTTALGTSLVNTLFVLDEPSIGLHARDMDRVTRVLQRLRDSGNTLIVVEHDPQLMLAADRIIDMGPGPGTAGGSVVFQGTPKQLAKSRKSLTAQYLSGQKVLTLQAPKQASPRQGKLTIQGARANNLKNLKVNIPLGCLVAVTGPSGSGKSTLIQDTLYNAVSSSKGNPKDQPGEHRSIKGAEKFDEIVLVDQSPIGKSARSNPVSYTGAFDEIRKQFATEPASRERGYTGSAFSFNSGMRCPVCSGNGFEHVEMQFLSDVYLRCAECQGTRYRPEVLEIKVFDTAGNNGKSIADVLALTVDDALEFFAGNKKVLTALQPLADVGLGYVQLGQPVPTLSGGEAQRLKLAAHLGKAAQKSDGKRLFLFDEPTTGLHFDDIDKLLRAFSQLIAEGHSIIVIEHNLDVIRNADWVIDLGPEGGDEGGELVFTGSVADLLDDPRSHTAIALREYEKEQNQLVRFDHSTREPAPLPYWIENARKAITVSHARENNLQNIDVSIPREIFTVITGMSGSGKSTLAFDIVFNEGQRRYLESLNAYARQFVQPASRPDVDAIYGIPPTVAIEQRTSRGGRKSTVATMTEIYHFLRLIYVKLGVQYCPDCNVAISAQSIESIIAQVQTRWRGKSIRIFSPLIVSRKGYYTDLAKWAAGKGFDKLLVDGEYQPTDNWPRLDRFREHSIDLPVGDLKVSPKHETALQQLLQRALDFGKGIIRIVPASGRGSREGILFSTSRACPSCQQSFPELDPRMFSYNSAHGWCTRCYGTGKLISGFDEEHSGEEGGWIDDDDEARVCPECDGQRLKPASLNVRFKDKPISAFTSLSVEEASNAFRQFKLAGREAEIARDILAELRSRLNFLVEVGLSYLTLDRSAPSLSGGEAQRIRLAAQLGSNLRGVCYILDEPTIGLHPRDNRMLLKTLRKLGGKGNTIVVVEHDEDTIRSADHIIDIGPGAGVRGGQVVAKGSVATICKTTASATGRMLSKPLQHPLYTPRRG
ncbi:MAG: excinuclease ABC subunit UvrA, partial [Gammaproteobacteria bacterium]|nr:excinuclease ABC subunit UvrA [Gammaproteobacteria bacterium]